jgi:hypothetical protein
VEQLRQKHEVITTSEEYGQMTIVLINREGSDVILNLARNYGIQVRAYLPDRITLEDAFIRLVKEAI